MSNARKYFFLIGIVALFMVPPAAFAQFKARFHFWIHAFIPKEHLLGPPGYILKTDKNTYVVPAPFNNDIVKLFDMSGLIGTCFSTDNRLASGDSASGNPTASARVTVELVAVIEGRNMRIEKAEGRPMRRIGPTHNVDCKTGKDKQPPRQESIDTITISNIRASGPTKTVSIKVASPNPFFKIAGTNIQNAPDIDFTVDLTYRHSNRRMYVKIDCGDFPAFEAYYKLNKNPAKMIISYPPAEGATAVNLFDFDGVINTRHVERSFPLR